MSVEPVNGARIKQKTVLIRQTQETVLSGPMAIKNALRYLDKDALGQRRKQDYLYFVLVGIIL